MQDQCKLLSISLHTGYVFRTSADHLCVRPIISGFSRREQSPSFQSSTNGYTVPGETTYSFRVGVAITLSEL